MSILGGANPIAADVFPFVTTDARFVRVNNLTNAGFPAATRLNEFAFRSSGPVVPVPSSLVLFGSGLFFLFGLVGYSRNLT